MLHLITVALLLILSPYTNSVAIDDFWEARKWVIAQEDLQAVGRDLELNEQEKCVSNILMEEKLREWSSGFQNPEAFLPGKHFFDSYNFVEQSPVYHFLKNMPKGAMLHTHFYGMVSGEFVYNLTYSEDLYVCFLENQMLLHFFYDHVDNRCDWVPVRMLRTHDKSFDKKLKKHTFISEITRNVPFGDSTDAQSAFESARNVLRGLITYKPIFYKYFYRALEELYEDKIFYVEFRASSLPVYDLEGNLYTPFDVINILQEIVEEFKCNHKAFLGAKLIYSSEEFIHGESNTLEEGLHKTLEIAKHFPNFVVGYDVMRREELDTPLAEVAETIQNSNLKFFFHAGTTNWDGALQDMNLLDAILMRTYRIGHGFGLMRHPELLKIVKDRNIPIEVCPISNQIFGLITDLRNHPATYFISQGFPVVVCNDDPGIYNSKAASFDWYMLFMGMSNIRSDLRLLKQLAVNSITYSAMDNKEVALVLFAKLWKDFINSFPRCQRSHGGEPNVDKDFEYTNAYVDSYEQFDSLNTGEFPYEIYGGLQYVNSSNKEDDMSISNNVDKENEQLNKIEDEGPNYLDLEYNEYKVYNQKTSEEEYTIYADNYDVENDDNYDDHKQESFK